ncbi:hypothetical protein BJH93_04015 [Kocuria polaris]|nr:hypothetical protein [Kocuria polaris]
MRAEYRCEHCDYATGIVGESDSYEDDMYALQDWNDEVDAHERACRERVEAERARRKAPTPAPADDVVDYMGQAAALLARADRAEATGQPMLAGTYRRAAGARISRARVALRLRRLEAVAPAWCRQVGLRGPEALVAAVVEELRVDDFLSEVGEPPIGAVLSARWKAVA